MYIVLRTCVFVFYQVMKKAQMIKKGHVRHKLKMRWFVLTSTDLFYYETKESLVKKVSILLCVLQGLFSKPVLFCPHMFEAFKQNF